MGLRARANFHELSYLQARALRFNSVMALRINCLVPFHALQFFLESMQSRLPPFSNRRIRGFRWVGYGG